MALDILRPYLASRILAHFAQGDELAKFDATDKMYGQHIQDVTPERPANCITSGPRFGDADSLHLPLLDDDAGIFRVVQSSTPGHQHVYINKAIRWTDFRRLLNLLAELELVDSAWAEQCITQNTATLRLPGEVKPRA